MDGCTCGGVFCVIEQREKDFDMGCKTCGTFIGGLLYWCARCGERQVQAHGQLCHVCRLATHTNATPPA